MPAAYGPPAVRPGSHTPGRALHAAPRPGYQPAAPRASAPLPQRGLHHVGQPPGHRPRLVDVGGLDHHPDQRLGAGRSAAAPGRWRPARAPPRRPPRPAPREVATRDLSTSGTLISTCGSRSMTPASSASVRPVAATRAASSSAGERAVAGGGVVEHDDVPGLLAAERVAVAPSSPPARSGRRPRSGRRSMPSRSIASLKPRLDMTVATTVFSRSVPGLAHREREHGQDLVAVDLRRRRRPRRGSGRRRRRGRCRGRRRARRRRPAAGPGGWSRSRR